MDSSSTAGLGSYTSGSPGWVRLRRVGNTFTGYYSSNGSSYTAISTTSFPMSGAALLGIAVSSHGCGVVGVGEVNDFLYVTPTFTATPSATRTPTPSSTWSPTVSVPVCAVWVTQGSAFSSGGGVTLTTAVNSQAGAAWSSVRLDLAQDFNMSFKAYFGAAAGADGLNFVLQDQGLTALGADGGGRGYAGITPSFAFDLGTFGTNGTLRPLENNVAQCGFASGTCPYAFPAALSNGVEHDYQVVWTASTYTLQLIVDGVLRQAYTRDLATAVFGGSTQVYWGFTAATGGLNNLHYIRQVSCSVPTPTATRTATRTASPTASPTATPTASPTRSPTASSSATPTLTWSVTATVTLTESPTVSATPTADRVLVARVFDRYGALVRDLGPQNGFNPAALQLSASPWAPEDGALQVSAGQGLWAWDGLADDGHPAPDGLYEIRVSGGSGALGSPLWVQHKARVAQLLAAPNPAKGPTVRFYWAALPAGTVQLAVHSLSGERVAVLHAPASLGVTAWDLRGASGEPVAGGLYLVRLELLGTGQRVRQTFKLAVAR